MIFFLPIESASFPPIIEAGINRKPDIVIYNPVASLDNPINLLYLVEMHGGTITINSTEGAGCEVYMQLPVTTVEQEALSGDLLMARSNVEKIHVEFSDIYSRD
jgi:hypothetical protein